MHDQVKKRKLAKSQTEDEVINSKRKHNIKELENEEKFENKNYETLNPDPKMKESIQESNKNQSESNYYTATQKSFVTTDFLPDKESNLKKSYDSPKKTAPSPSNTRPRRRDLEVVRKHEN